jgi:hypothetical protein
MKGTVVEAVFADIDERHLFRPRALIIVEANIDEQIAAMVEALFIDVVKRAIQRQRAMIRREVINAKIAATDLSSFLYRMLKGSRVLSILGVEAASVFVRDDVSGFLKLRGSTGVKDGTPLNQLFFTESDGTKVWRVFKEREPLFEFDPGRLPEGRTAEQTSRGTFSRAYWPIQLQKSSVDADRKARHPCLGTLRVVNSRMQNTIPPLTWLEVAAMEFLCESLYNIIDAFHDADLAGFRKEQSFHAAMSVVDGLAKSVDRARRLLFDFVPPDPVIKRLFEVRSADPARAYDSTIIRRFLDTAYACARDIGFQIERANYEFSGNRGATTSRLITNVVKRAADVMPDLCLAHSVKEGFEITNPLSFLNPPHTPPPSVKGAEDALFSVFVNIFENATKYRKPGNPVRIEIGYELDADHVRFTIRDYGIGILHGEEDRIFSAGYRSQAAISHTPKGSGLGLSWCRSIASFYDGEVSAARAEPGLSITLSLKRIVQGA